MSLSESNKSHFCSTNDMRNLDHHQITHKLITKKDLITQKNFIYETTLDDHCSSSEQEQSLTSGLWRRKKKWNDWRFKNNIVMLGIPTLIVIV